MERQTQREKKTKGWIYLEKKNRCTGIYEHGLSLAEVTGESCLISH